MAKKSEYNYLGSTHHFKKRPPKKDDGEWLWMIGLGIVVLFLLSSCS